MSLAKRSVNVTKKKKIIQYWHVTVYHLVVFTQVGFKLMSRDSEPPIHFSMLAQLNGVISSRSRS